MLSLFFFFSSNPVHFTVLASGIHSGGSFAWAFPWLARVLLVLWEPGQLFHIKHHASTFAWLTRQIKNTSSPEMPLTA